MDDVLSSQYSGGSSQNSVDSSMAQTAERIGSCLQDNSEADPAIRSNPNSHSGSSFLELLQSVELYSQCSGGSSQNSVDSSMAHTAERIGSCSQDNSEADLATRSSPTSLVGSSKASIRPIIPSSNYPLQMTPNSGILEVESFETLGEEILFSDISKKIEENCTSEHSGITAESVSQAMVQKVMTASSQEAPKSPSESNHACSSPQEEVNKIFQSQNRPVGNLKDNVQSQTQEHNCRMQCVLEVPNLSREASDVTESTSVINNPKNNEHKEVESSLKDHGYLPSKAINGTSLDSSNVKRGRTAKQKQEPVDWDSLRLQAQAKGKRRERTAKTMDSLDWEAIRLADVKEVADTIKERGMNNVLAGRIKDFLNRMVREHGSIDLEWLRDVPPDKAKYPVLESIQRYLWPRLCKLDQRTLYELHYQMITFGKVFCTKSKPNCNVCPLRGECRHFASAFASARLALPGPEEKSIVNATENKAANQNPVEVLKPLQLPLPQADRQLQAQYQIRNCEPIIEVPASPEPIVEVPTTPEPEPQVPESDIEDAFFEDPEEIPMIKLNFEEFTQNLQNYMRQNMELQEGDMSKALVSLTPEAASIPTPKLKNVSQLRTEHQVYELPDSHPLLDGLDKREPDDPCSYLLAIWTPGETANSIQPPESKCSSQQFGKLCDENTCFSCNSIREANSQTVRGTLLVYQRKAFNTAFGEMPGRRSNYTLLSQVPDDHNHQPPGGGAGPYYESLSGEKNKGKGGGERGFDWDLIDHRRIGAAFQAPIALQRQSSGSSFGESSMSGEFYVPSVADSHSHLHDDVFKVGGGGDFRFKAAEIGGGGSSSSRSWAQQTEESYQLQLALALRLSSEATCADDPNFLDPVPDESASLSFASSDSVESVSHRFWVNGCLSYSDRIPDGFYLIHGMDPYVWTVCTNLQENGRIPSIELLKAADPRIDSSIQVILIDQHSDPSLKELQNRIHRVSCRVVTTEEVVDELAKIICNRMGGAASTGEDDFLPAWKECSDDLKESLRSTVLPIGSLSVGLCRHRALLFKVLADTIDLPCRIAKGCKYCKRDDAATCLVRFGPDRECLVDLIGKPGCLCEPDSLLNGPSSILLSSPLCFPRFRQVEPPIDFRLGTVDGDTGDSTYPKQSDRQCMDRHNHVPSPSNSNESHDRDLQLLKSSNPHTIISSTNMVKDPVPLKHFPPIGHREVQPLVGLSDPRGNAKDLRFVEGGQMVPRQPSKKLSLDVEDLDIPWSDLVLKERIGSGSFGTVHRADWHGSICIKERKERELYIIHTPKHIRVTHTYNKRLKEQKT
ncbi:hypothetical protein HYC85_006830 [Camellia sinensis]|uniref:Protein kinase domain-containing protein n=1 Tax=Camellia sinensis TaxID=4442 RepID=A0A7J7HPN7_CAMSI|nr:hypothetical protein HYC85_006830 [Camellia sinensis]